MDEEEIGRETSRLEAFSDGVFAIAITLLILNIKVPGKDIGDGKLWEVLGQQWADYLAYVISFVTILVMWSAHHNIFRYIRRTDHPFLLINGLLLMGVTIVPFPTSLLATHFSQENNARAAAAVYSGTFLFIALCFNALWVYASYKDRLLDKTQDVSSLQGIAWAYIAGPILYLLALILSFFSLWATVIICILLTIFYSLPSLVNRT